MKKAKLIVNAPIETVWQTLSKLDDIDVVIQGIKSAHMSSSLQSGQSGVGSQRACEIDGFGTLVESIVEWNEGSSFKYEVAGMPAIMRQLSNRWEMRAVGNTTEVSMEIEARTKFGPIGRLIERLALRPRITAGAASSIAQVKYYFEQGKPYAGNVDKLVKKNQSRSDLIGNSTADTQHEPDWEL